MSSRRSIALAVMLAAAISIVVAVPAGAAQPFAGRTLSYRGRPSGGKSSGAVVGRTAGGRIAIVGSSPKRAYAQYDGKVLWSCVVGRQCRIVSRGAKARKVADFIETEFFKPCTRRWARVFMTHQARRTPNRRWRCLDL